MLVGPDHTRLLDHVILDPVEQRSAIEPWLQFEIVV
jgi:hypothetical protein